MEASVKMISRSVFAQAHESFIKDGDKDFGSPKLDDLVHFKHRILKKRLEVKSAASIGFELSRWKDGTKCKSTTEVWKPISNKIIAAAV